MGTITAQNIFDRVGLIVNETTPSRWLAAEMLKWLNDGQRVIGSLKPDACCITEAKVQAAGSKQTLPAGSFLLLNVIRNMGASPGTTAGNVVRLVQRRTLDDEIPGWHAATQSATTEAYVYEPEIDPRVYYIYPPSTGANYLEICHAKAPTELTSTSDVISLDDIYEPALLSFVLHKLFSKDADFVVNEARSQQFFNEFLLLIGRMDVVEALKNPNMSESQRAMNTIGQS